ncbi:MAG: PepSY domain-containing protein [Alphaproteobacteria bacterium]|nr:PepSY domain-containing protein [Alphaproteobacteria bacterium]
MSGILSGRFILLAGLVVLQAVIFIPAYAASEKLSMAAARAMALEKEDGRVIDYKSIKTAEDEVLAFFIKKEDGKVMRVEVGRQSGKVLTSKLDYIPANTPLPQGAIKQSQARDIAKNHVTGIAGTQERAVIVGSKLNLRNDKPVYHFEVSIGKVVYDVQIAPEDGKVLWAEKQTAGQSVEEKPSPASP